MGVVGVVKRFVHLLAERCETVFPALFPSEVGVVGVKLELYFVLQAIEHCMEHIGVFGKESGVYTYVIDHRLLKELFRRRYLVARSLGFMWLLLMKYWMLSLKVTERLPHMAAT